MFIKSLFKWRLIKQGFVKLLKRKGRIVISLNAPAKFASKTTTSRLSLAVYAVVIPGIPGIHGYLSILIYLL